MDAGDDQMERIKLNVEGMHCKSCVALVKDDLEELGAKNIDIKLDEKTKRAVVSCEYDSKEKVVEIIKKNGYKVR